MTKRAPGEGSIYKHKGGWKVAFSVGQLHGKRKRFTRNAKTQADAKAALEELREQYGNGRAFKPSLTSVADRLRQWLDDCVTGKLAESTDALWRHVAKEHIVKRIGSIRMAKLRRSDVQEFIDSMSRDKVPTRMQQVAFEVLRKLLAYADKRDLIPGNPSDGLEKPSHRSKDIFPFTETEMQAILKNTVGTRWHALYVLAVTTGMRQGELFGLQRKSVNMKAKTITVCQAVAEVRNRLYIRKPKTEKSIRVIEIPAVAFVALKDHAAIMLREGNAGNEYLFPDRKGRLIKRTQFARRPWKALLKKLKFEPRGFHHVRHSYACHALTAGVPLHIVSKILGHARPSTTLNTYSHLLKDQQNLSTDAMQRLYG